jgi:hypothetical protein
VSNAGLSSCEWALFHGLSWGVPLGCVLGLVYGDLLSQSPDLHLCFPKKPWHVILWYVVVFFIFVVALIVIVCFLKSECSSS